MNYKYRLINLNNIISSNESSVKEFLKYYGVRKFDSDDIIALQSISKCISCDNRKQFNVSYNIARLDKEFDLIKIGNNIIVNIELKLSTPDVEQCRDNYKLLKNIYSDYCVFCFTYIKDENALLKLNSNEKILEESSFEILNEILSRIEVGEVLKIDINISSIYNNSDFSYNDYFLSNWQKSSFIGVIGSDKKTNIVTGRPGSGKSVLALYLCDYYSKNSKYSVKYLVPFMFKDIINSDLINKFKINTVKNFCTGIPEIKCDVCIIDEAQRISSTEFQYLQKSVKHKIILVGDINQNIGDESYFESLHSDRKNDIAYFNMTGVTRTDDTFDLFARKILDIPKKVIKNKVVDNKKINILMYDELFMYDVSNYIYIEPTKSKYYLDCHDECKHERCNKISKLCLNKKNTHNVVSCEYDNVLLYLCDGFEIRSGEIKSNKKVCYLLLKSHLYSIITRTVNNLIIVTDNIEVYNFLMKAWSEM